MIFVRVCYNNGFEPTKTPIKFINGLHSTKGLEAIFDQTVEEVEARKHTHVEKVEVKNGRKVLFMQRFENGVRL